MATKDTTVVADETRPSFGLGHTFSRARRLAKHGSLFLGLVAICKGIVVLGVLEAGYNPVVLAVAFLGAVTIYTHNTVTDLGEDEVNRPEQAQFAAEHRGTLVALSALAYLFALGLSATGGVDGVLVTLAPGIAAVMYSEPWIPGTGIDRLKEVAVANTALVALAWAVPLTYLPVALGAAPAGPTALLVCAFIFWRTFGAVEVMNVRDIVGDRAAGVGTLPVVLGIRRTQWILWGIDALCIAMLLVGATTGVLAPVLAGALAAVIPYSIFVTSLLNRGIDRELLGTAKDAEYVLMAAAVIVVSVA